ncbi:MAG TPA: biotin synthase, partial [Thermoanaerobaculia bacterium]|nr:biotin synthase [Thermoanaerobaculia bacterium]
MTNPVETLAPPAGPHADPPADPHAGPRAGLRHDWSDGEIAAIHDLPLTELVFRAQLAHRRHHDPTRVQLCTLLSIKTGGCPEDCGY